MPDYDPWLPKLPPADGGWREDWTARLQKAGIPTAVDTSEPELLLLYLAHVAILSHDGEDLDILACDLRVPPKERASGQRVLRYVLDHWYKPAQRELVRFELKRRLIHRPLRAAPLAPEQVEAYVHKRIVVDEAPRRVCWVELAWNAWHAVDPQAARAMCRASFGAVEWDEYAASAQAALTPFLWMVYMQPHIQRLDQAAHGRRTRQHLSQRVRDLQTLRGFSEQSHDQATQRVRQLERLLSDLDREVRRLTEARAFTLAHRAEALQVLLDAMDRERHAWMQAVAASRSLDGATAVAPSPPLAGRRIRLLGGEKIAAGAAAMARFLGAAKVVPATAVRTGADSDRLEADLVVAIAPAHAPRHSVPSIAVSTPTLAAVARALQTAGNGRGKHHG